LIMEHFGKNGSSLHERLDTQIIPVPFILSISKLLILRLPDVKSIIQKLNANEQLKIK